MGRRGEALRHPRHTARNTHPQSEDRMTPLHAHATLTAAMHRMLADDPAAIRAALSQPPRPPNPAPPPRRHPPPPQPAPPPQQPGARHRRRHRRSNCDRRHSRRALAAGAAMTATPSPLSPSQAEHYLECGFRWYCRHVLRIPEPVTPALAIGRAVHQVADALLRGKGADRQAGRACTITQADVEDLAPDLTHDAMATVDAPDTPDPDIEAERAQDRQDAANQVQAMCELWWRQAAPSIDPAGIEVPVSGVIAGVPVTGIVDILDTSGRGIELKTETKKQQRISASHYLQVVTYAILTAPAQPPQDPDWPTPRSGPGARLDTLTKTHAPGYYSHSLTVDDDAARYAESIYPMVAEAIGDGLYLPRRSSNLCSRRHCAYWQTCEAEFGGSVRP